MSPRDPNSLDDRSDLAELLELLNSFAQDAGPADTVRNEHHQNALVAEPQTAPETVAQITAETEAQAAPETENQTPLEIEDRQTDLNKLLELGQNLAEQPVGPHEGDHNRFAAHIIQGMAKMRARLRDEE